LDVWKKAAIFTLLVVAALTLALPAAAWWGGMGFGRGFGWGGLGWGGLGWGGLGCGLGSCGWGGMWW
jgi:hypothetical protein